MLFHLAAPAGRPRVAPYLRIAAIGARGAGRGDRAAGRLLSPQPLAEQVRLYHPEAITLSVSPKSALSPVLAAARTATREVLGSGAADGAGDDEWAPRRTLCYSATEQPAAPVIAALGQTLQRAKRQSQR